MAIRFQFNFIHLLPLLLCVLAGPSALAQTTFQYHYDESMDEMVVGMTNTFDGGFATVGFAAYPGTGTDLVLAKFGSDGISTWEYRYTGPGAQADQGTAIIQLADSGFAVVGISSSYHSNDGDILLLRTDKNGNLLWNRVYDGGTFYDYGYGICAAPDGGIAISGLVSRPGNHADVFIAKVDANGNPLWSRYIGGSAQDGAADLVCTSDSGFVAGGYTHSFGPGNPAANVRNNYLVKVDKNGALVYTLAFGRSTHDEDITSLDHTSTGGVVYCGNAYLGTQTRPQAGAVNGLGTRLWATEFTSDSTMTTRAIVETYDRGFVMTGHSNSSQFNDSAPAQNVYLLRLNGNGSLRWARSYGQSGHAEMAQEVIAAPDTGFVVGGAHADLNFPNLNVYIFKTDSAGFTTCDDQVATPSASGLSLTGSSGGTSVSGVSGVAVALTRLSGNWARSGLCTILAEGSLALQARAEADGVRLHWQLPPGQGLTALQLERSPDGRTFTRLRALDREAARLDFWDAFPEAGDNYYRLLARDAQGEVRSSQVVVVRFAPAVHPLRVWPNPCRGSAQVSFALEMPGQVELQVVDLAGRVVRTASVTGNAGRNACAIGLPGLSAGAYFVQAMRVDSGKFLGRQKLLKVK